MKKSLMNWFNNKAIIISISLFIFIFGNVLAYEDCDTKNHCFQLGIKAIENSEIEAADHFFFIANDKGDMRLEELLNISQTLYDMSTKEQCNRKKALIHYYAYNYLEFASSMYKEFIGINRTVFDKARYPLYTIALIRFDDLQCYKNPEYEEAIINDLGGFADYEGLANQSIYYFKASQSINDYSPTVDSQLKSNILRHLMIIENLGFDISQIQITPRKNSGGSCNSDIECFSEHCNNTICCDRNQNCCTSDTHCRNDTICDNVNNVCVEKKSEAILKPDNVTPESITDNNRTKENININNSDKKTKIENNPFYTIISIITLIIFSYLALKKIE